MHNNPETALPGVYSFVILMFAIQPFVHTIAYQVIFGRSAIRHSAIRHTVAHHVIFGHSAVRHTVAHHVIFRHSAIHRSGTECLATIDKS